MRSRAKVRKSVLYGEYDYDWEIPQLAEAERLLIARVLHVTGGNQSYAAKLLGIERHRLRRRIVVHGLEHLAHIRTR